MAILLDSDVIIDFLKGRESGITVMEVFLKEKLFISIVTWMEIVYGTKRSSAPRKREDEFEHFLSALSIKILPVDKPVADIFIELKSNLEKEEKPLPDFDLLIAATALAHNLSLATRNVKHFSRIKKLKLAIPEQTKKTLGGFKLGIDKLYDDRDKAL